MFHALLDEVLLPQLRRPKPGAGLVTDNPLAHNAKRVRELLGQPGFACHYRPTYSAELNLIE